MCLHLRQPFEVHHVRDICLSCISQASWPDCGSEAGPCTACSPLAVLRMVKVQSCSLRRGDVVNLRSQTKSIWGNYLL